MAINAVADMLSSGTGGVGSEEDPELIGDALPFALITLESLAESAPEHEGLRTTLAGGFVQYAYAYVDLEAELIKYEDYERYKALQDRARKLYLRGKRWGMEGLELRHAGFGKALEADPKAAVKPLTKKDMDLIYWTAAGWLAAISISTDRPALIAQLPLAVAMLERGLELDPDYGDGGLHELFVALDMSRDPGAGGGLENAVKHYERALELSKGQRASVFVGYATSIAVKQQDRKKFDEMIERALSIDPDQYPNNRLVNLLSQRKASYLKEHVEDLFDAPVESEEEPPAE